MNIYMISVIAATAILFLSVLVFLRRVVPTNKVHIVQYSKKTVSYGAGREAGNTYYAWPAWVPKLGVEIAIYPESIFDISLTRYEAYDIGRLPFMVDVAAFFRITNSDVAANKVSSVQELEEQLKKVLQGAVRRILSINLLEKIMEDRSELGDAFTREVDEQLKEWGVGTVKTIEFMDIQDIDGSNVIQEMMAKEQSRINKESRVQVAANNQAAEEAEIQSTRIVEVKRQEAQQLVGLRTAEKEQAVGIANEQSKQKVQEQTALTAEKEMEVKRVNETKAAEIERTVQVVEAESYKQTIAIKAEADLDATNKTAAGKIAIGKAEGEAETAKLMAPVDSQIALATEIGENDGYQKYLVTIRKVEAEQAVGVAMAEAISKAELKVIANSGNISEGVSGLGRIFTPEGGTNLAGMATAMAQTPEGELLLKKVTEVAKKHTKQ